MWNDLRFHPIFLGACFAFVQTILFAFIGVFVRLASETHHVMDIMFYRMVIGLLAFTIILSVKKNGWQNVRQANLKRQIIRAIVGTATMVAAFATFSYLTLSEAQSLFYAGPLFALFLSYPLLKEKVGLYRASAAILGFLGVILIAQPANISSFIGGILGILTALGFAGVTITLRWLGKTENAIVTAFYFTLFGTIITLPFTIFVWSMPSAQSFFYIIIISLIAVGVQITITKAYFLAPPSVIAPITYLCLIWSIALDVIIWGVWPLPATLAGAGFIIMANVFIIYREIRLKTNKPKA